MNGLYNGLLTGTHNGLYQNEVRQQFIPYKPKLLLDFEGGSRDLSGNNVAITDVSMSYGYQYGRRSQGTFGSLATSKLTLTALATGVNFTVSMWIYILGGTTYASIFATNNQTGFYLRTDLRRVIYYQAGDKVSTIPIPFNQWINLTITMQGTEMWVYVNGVRDSRPVVVLSGGFSGNTMWNDTATEKLNAYVDSFILDSAAWTPYDVKRYYEQTKLS